MSASPAARRSAISGLVRRRRSRPSARHLAQPGSRPSSKRGIAAGKRNSASTTDGPTSGRRGTAPSRHGATESIERALPAGCRDARQRRAGGPPGRHIRPCSAWPPSIPSNTTSRSCNCSARSCANPTAVSGREASLPNHETGEVAQTHRNSGGVRLREDVQAVALRGYRHSEQNRYSTSNGKCRLQAWIVYSGANLSRASTYRCRSIPAVNPDPARTSRVVTSSRVNIRPRTDMFQDPCGDRQYCLVLVLTM